jgi:ribosomal protein S18 acetylase RimI-like enzyme
LQIAAAHYLFSRYRSLAKFIADEVMDAYRGTGYVDGKQYVLKEVRGERTIANAIATYRSRGFRDVRAVPIDATARNPQRVAGEG